MNLLLLNVLLAVLWCFMWGGFNLALLLSGFAVGFLLLWLITRNLPQPTYGTKMWTSLSFTVYFVFILVKANIQVAKIVLRPRFREASRVVRYSVEGMTDLQVTSLANIITLTPGTLSMDIDEENGWLYVHCMSAADRDEAMAEIDELRDRMMKELFV